MTMAGLRLAARVAAMRAMASGSGRLREITSRGSIRSVALSQSSTGTETKVGPIGSCMAV